MLTDQTPSSPDKAFIENVSLLRQLAEVREALETTRASLAQVQKEALDILWRDLDGLRDPKLALTQVAAKASNAIHWRNQAK